MTRKHIKIPHDRPEKQHTDMSSFSSLLRHSDRKAAQILGITLSRDEKPKTRTNIHHVLKRHRSVTPEQIVWDVPNPFGPPDPALAHVQALIQAEITRTRQFESIAPHERVHDALYEDDSEHEDFDSDSEDDTAFDDEDHTEDDTDNEDEGKHAPITLPRLLPIPLRFIPSPPPPSPASSDEDRDFPASWADLAQAYDDIAEAEERAARKAKRDAHRSRAKVLAILGPEASSAL